MFGLGMGFDGPKGNIAHSVSYLGTYEHDIMCSLIFK